MGIHMYVPTYLQHSYPIKHASFPSPLFGTPFIVPSNSWTRSEPCSASSTQTPNTTAVTPTISRLSGTALRQEGQPPGIQEPTQQSLIHIPPASCANPKSKTMTMRSSTARTSPLLRVVACLLVSSAPVSYASDNNNTPNIPDILSQVNPLIGSTNGGNVFPGATRPYGLAKAAPDVDGLNTGGFSTDGSNITGFSALHDSGTGGNPSLGNFPLFPQLCPDDDLNRCRFRIGDRKVPYVKESVVAEPGRFSVELGSGIRANMTVSEHAALYTFQFPGGDSEGMAHHNDSGGLPQHPLVMLDLTDLWQSRQNASVSVDETSGRMLGNGTFLPSFGAGSYVVHFCVDFFGPGRVYDSGVWVNGRAGTEPKELFLTRGFNLFYLEGGAFVRFEPGADSGSGSGSDSTAMVTVTARVGLSFKSAEQACRSAETEIPDPRNDFGRLVEEARGEWRDKLQSVSVTAGGASEDLVVSFWSGIYRNMISPQNYTGENPHWDTGRPYFDSFYWYGCCFLIHLSNKPKKTKKKSFLSSPAWLFNFSSSTLTTSPFLFIFVALPIAYGIVSAPNTPSSLSSIPKPRPKWFSPC